MKTGPVLVRLNETGGRARGGRRRRCRLPTALLGAAVTAAWPPAMTAEEADEDRRGAVGRGIGDEADDAAVDRLDRVVGRHGHGQRVGERRADRRRLRGAAGDEREGEALALEGADVDGAADAGRGRAGRCVGDAGPLVPASMAGLPGSRAMVWVGPP